MPEGSKGRPRPAENLGGQLPGQCWIYMQLMKEFRNEEQHLNLNYELILFLLLVCVRARVCVDTQNRDSPETASSFTLVSSDLQRKDKFMRILFSCNVRKVQHTVYVRSPVFVLDVFSLF